MPQSPDQHPLRPVDDPGFAVDSPQYAQPGSSVVDEPGEVSDTGPVTEDGSFGTTTFATQTTGT